MRPEYRQWLVQQGYQANTIIAQLHRAGRVEEHHGDLDGQYAADRLEGVIRILSYSKEDERAARPNASNIPFDGDIYNNLASYRNAVLRYKRFRDFNQGVPENLSGAVLESRKAPKVLKKPLVDGVASLVEVLNRAGYRSTVEAVAKHTVFLDPRTVRQAQGDALFPVIRGARGKIVTLPDGRILMQDDNLIPTDMFLWAAARARGADVQFNHIWTDAKNTDLYTALWNVCATPAFLAKTTDGKNHPEVSAALQYRAFELYGVHPLGLEPARPTNYNELIWAPMPDPIEDLQSVLRAHLKRKPLHRAAVTARRIGWYFSNGTPDTSLGI